MAIAGKIRIEAKIRDIERLDETVKKCVAVAKAHPHVVDINIRVDATSLLCNNDALADQKRAPKLDINPDDLQHRQKDYLNLAMLFRTSLDSVKDNYDILVQQCREVGMI